MLGLLTNPRAKLIEKVQAGERAKEDVADAAAAIRSLRGMEDHWPIDLLYEVKADAIREPIDPAVRAEYAKLRRAMETEQAGEHARQQLLQMPDAKADSEVRELRKRSLANIAEREKLETQRDRFWGRSNSDDEVIAEHAKGQLALIQRELEECREREAELQQAITDVTLRKLEL